MQLFNAVRTKKSIHSHWKIRLFPRGKVTAAAQEKYWSGGILQRITKNMSKSNYLRLKLSGNKCLFCFIMWLYWLLRINLNDNMHLGCRHIGGTEPSAITFHIHRVHSPALSTVWNVKAKLSLERSRVVLKWFSSLLYFLKHSLVERSQQQHKLCRPGPATLLILKENVAELITPNISSIIHSG